MSVVIVSYNGRILLASCLGALFAGSRVPDEVIVVDNASHDDSVRWLRDTYPDIRIIQSACNLGFAAGTNRGIAAARCEYVFTLNNDVEVEPDALEQMVATLDDGGGSLGAVMSVMVFAHRPEIVACRGLEIFTDGVVKDAGVGERYQRAVVPYPVFGPSAGAALYRRAALDDVGRFDPAFFMYLEDADLAWRLRLRGWDTLVAPAARVRHAVSGTAGYGSPRKAYLLARNRWWCLLKNMPGELLRAHRADITRYDAAALAYAALVGDRASLAGRRDALRDLPAIRRSREHVQRRVTVSEDELAPWLRPAPPLGDTLRERRLIAALVKSGD